jgi:hypothetical protein
LTQAQLRQTRIEELLPFPIMLQHPLNFDTKPIPPEFFSTTFFSPYSRHFLRDRVKVEICKPLSKRGNNGKESSIESAVALLA